MEMQKSAAFRMESDSIGSREVPAEAYYGVQTLRAAENFRITGRKLHPEMINSLAKIKKACAEANAAAGALDGDRAAAIVKACDMIIAGGLRGEFIVDPVQGGAGTSMNMNANEVIANAAIEIMGGRKGDYSVISPNDHVNCGQSTNDVIPTAGKMTALVLLGRLTANLRALESALREKSAEFDSVIKMGRTQLQDAVPVRLGQEFGAYASAVARGIGRIEKAGDELLDINMGGTAIGTGLNADPEYFAGITPALARVSGLPFRRAGDLIDATQNIDCFAAVSGAVKACALAMSKIANDLRLISSGPRDGLGEINLPAMQNGSSIMPGKVNPVIPEVVTQVAFETAGCDVTISMAAEAGQLELNAFEPVVFDCLFRAVDELAGAADTFTTRCVRGITANAEKCRDYVDSSVGTVTALCPRIGYVRAAALAKKALAQGLPVRRLVLDEGVMEPGELDAVLDTYAMTKPGISGRAAK